MMLLNNGHKVTTHHSEVCEQTMITDLMELQLTMSQPARSTLPSK